MSVPLALAMFFCAGVNIGYGVAVITDYFVMRRRARLTCLICGSVLTNTTIAAHQTWHDTITHMADAVIEFAKD